MKTLTKTLVTSTILVTAISAYSTANAEHSLAEAFEAGTPYIDARYRYEFVDQDGKAEDAHASTLRTRLGYKSGEYHGFSGTLEFENITQLGGDNYNDTLNGRSDHPTVADPESTEVNQVFLQYSGLENTTIKAGRQVINLDNQRFIGAVGWRQNNQTFDAVTLSSQFLPETTFNYGYISNVNRIFGEDSSVGDYDSDSHFLNISNNSLPIGKLTAYGYLVDLEEDAPALSSRTYGLSLNGKQKLDEDWKLKYHLEYAHQSDHGDNPTDYSTDYYHIAPAIGWKGLTATLGYEVLGSDDGAIGFSTPLATLHKFNGVTDKFLSTPANGLEDLYFSVKYDFGACDCNVMNGLMVKAAYHDFSADEGSADYGSEYSFYAKKKVTDNYYVEAKYAQYDADTVSTDTQKFVLGIGLKY